MERQAKSFLKLNAVSLSLAMMVMLAGRSFEPAHAAGVTDTALFEQSLDRLSIVPEDSRISDLEAHLSLAEILSYRQNTQREAAQELKLLVTTTSLSSPNSLIGDRDTLVRLGAVAANIGHAREARNLYDRALGLPGATPELAVRYADRMGGWGDFHAAERIYRAYLLNNPASRETLIKLAKLLASSERYEEAEGIYRQLLLQEHDPPDILAELARVKSMDKDFTASLELIERALALAPHDPGMLGLKASTLLRAGRFTEARNVYRLLSDQKAFMADAFIGIAQTYIAEKSPQMARPYAEQALALSPGNLDARFYRDWSRITDAKYLQSLLTEDLWAPQLEQLGNLYASHGFAKQAEQCYTAALARDPEYFSAMLGLADIGAFMGRYDEAVEAYKRLVADFPGNSKIRIGLARILGWSKRYDESIALYGEISKGNPADPLPVKEKARTAVWGKQMDRAVEYYDSLLDPLQRTEAAKRIQKGAILERDAKLLAWNKRFIHAIDRYEELISFQPGNEEALFDKGQAECALGLCCDARETYRRLLVLDPLHNLAGEALHQDQINRSPSLEISQDYWQEEGRGELSRISRYKSAAGVNIPVFGCYNLNMAGNAWVEAPKNRGESYAAYGHTIGFSGVINRYVSGSMGWTRKQYEMSVLGVKNSGHAHLSVNLNDFLRWDLNYDRKDELYNNYGIRQGGVQSDTWSMGISGNPVRNLSLAGTAGYLRYNDHNEGRFATLSAGYGFTDHPRIFKITANAEYRNIVNENRYVYNRADQVIDITHPYWTPKDYIGESLTFEWYHDLSPQFFCGSRKHFYDVKVTFGTDTDSNPSARFEAEWRHELHEHWLFSLKGMIHRSREWDAIGGWFEIGYRF